MALRSKLSSEISGQIISQNWDEVIQDLRDIDKRASASARQITDWHSIAESGIYYTVASTNSNAPEAVSYYVGSATVYDSNWSILEVIGFNDNDESLGTKSYYKEKNNGTWTSWQKIYKTKGELDQEYVTKSGNSTITGNTIITGNLRVNSSSTTGGGIILSDDGDIVDMNNGAISIRSSIGAMVYTANGGGIPSIHLRNDGHIWTSQYGWLSDKFNAFITANNTTLTGTTTLAYPVVINTYAGIELRSTEGFAYTDYTSANRQTDYDWRTLSSLNGVDYQLWYGNPANTGNHGQAGEGHKYTLNANGSIWTSKYNWLEDEFLQKRVNGVGRLWYSGNSLVYSGDLHILGRPNAENSSFGGIAFQRNNGVDGVDAMWHTHPTNDHFYLYKRGRNGNPDSYPLVVRPTGRLYTQNPAQFDDELATLGQVKSFGGGRVAGEIAYFARSDSQFTDEKNNSWLLLNGQSTPTGSISRAYFGTTLPNNQVSTSPSLSTFIQGLSGPNDIAIDSQGNFIILLYNAAVLKYSPDGTFISTIASDFGYGLRGLSVDSNDNIYIGSYNSAAVFKLTMSGVLTTLAGISDATDTENDSAGNVYVTCYSQSAIFKVTPAGAVSQFATVPNAWMLAKDNSGDLYCTTLDNAVYKIPLATGIATVLCGNGTVASIDYCPETNELFGAVGNVLRRINPLSGAVSDYVTLPTSTNWHGTSFVGKTAYYVSHNDGKIYKITPSTSINPYTVR